MDFTSFAFGVVVGVVITTWGAYHLIEETMRIATRVAHQKITSRRVGGRF
jgi:hypothetical protein